MMTGVIFGDSHSTWKDNFAINKIGNYRLGNTIEMHWNRNKIGMAAGLSPFWRCIDENTIFRNLGITITVLEMDAWKYTISWGEFNSKCYAWMKVMNCVSQDDNKFMRTKEKKCITFGAPRHFAQNFNPIGQHWLDEVEPTRIFFPNQHKHA